MDNKEMQALIKIMSEKIDFMEKRQRMQRTCNIIAWLAVCAIVITLLVVVGPKVKAAYDTYTSVMSEIESTLSMFDKINVDAINKTLSALDNIDIEALNQKFAEIGKLTDKLAKIDLDGLTEIINDLVKTLEPLKGLLRK